MPCHMQKKKASMAKHHIVLLFLLSLDMIITTPSLAEDQGNDDLRLKSQKPIGLPSTESLTHLRFFWHDILGGPNATDDQVVLSPEPKPTIFSFGSVFVFDDVITVGPEVSSKLVGRAQGFYVATHKTAVIKENVALTAMTFAFTEGEYNGSTLAIFGRNEVFTDVREMPVVGGSGLFRLARGFARATTYSFDIKTTKTVVEYNVFVIH